MVLDPNLYPNITGAAFLFLNRALNPGRPLYEDPITNNTFVIRIEDINEDILCTRVEPPEIKVQTYEIKQNNSLTPVYVPQMISIGPITLHKSVGLGNSDSPRPSTPTLTRDAFQDWITQVVDDRDSFGVNQQGLFRKDVYLILFDNTKSIAAEWIAYGCVPISYTPFSPLDGLASAILVEDIVLQPEGFERVV